MVLADCRTEHAWLVPMPAEACGNAFSGRLIRSIWNPVLLLQWLPLEDSRRHLEQDWNTANALHPTPNATLQEVWRLLYQFPDPWRAAMAGWWLCMLHCTSVQGHPAPGSGAWGQGDVWSCSIPGSGWLDPAPRPTPCYLSVLWGTTALNQIILECLSSYCPPRWPLSTVLSIFKGWLQSVTEAFGLISYVTAWTMKK